MRVVGLFAGVGGLELGLSNAGHRAELLCEVWEPARAVLAARFPEVDDARDIGDLAALPGNVELVTGGFPCQDLSQAGLTRGIGGARSGLVSHVFRLLERSRAPLVLLENVPFMLQLGRGAAMAALVEGFEALGYRWAYRTVNSLAFLPHRRERVFFLASRCDLDPEDVLFADDVIPNASPTTLSTHAHGFYWTEGVRGLGWAPDAIPTLKNGSTVGIPSPPAILMPDGRVIKPDLRDAERLQGLPEDWTLPAETAGRASLRWSLVGNAVSSPVAAWLGRRLAEPAAYLRDRDGQRIGDERWPSAARGGDGEPALEVKVGKFPVAAPRQPLHRFLRHEGEPLSARATRGFLRRTERSTLRFKPGFLDRLRDHLRLVDTEKLAA